MSTREYESEKKDEVGDVHEVKSELQNCLRNLNLMDKLILRKYRKVKDQKKRIGQKLKARDQRNMKRMITKQGQQKIPSVGSEYSKESHEAEDEFRDYNKRIEEHSYEEEGYSREYSNSQALIDFENLDIEPIQNTTGDKFVIDQTSQQETYSQNSTYKSQPLQFLQSSVWADVFYAKKSIMNLLQQRNQVCEIYNLNSKSLKQINTTQASKRIYTDLQIAQYAKQLFEESPSYDQLDNMCFTVIPQMSSIAQKYFVFMGCDDRFVPQCKSCNISAYLILNVEVRDKSQITHSSFGDKLKKSAWIKGKILCSNSKCKKKLLGEFVISQEEKKPQYGSMSPQNTYSSNCGIKIQRVRNQTEESEQNRQSLSEKQKILIKKAAMKVNL